jgi:hypothetical protein
MRTILLSVLLAGCADAYDATWLVTATYKDDTCNPDSDQIGTETQTYVNTFTTAAGTFGTSIDGLVLTGERVGPDFDLSWEYGTSTESDDCDTIVSLTQFGMDGTFSADGGMEGDLNRLDGELIDGCDDTDLEDEVVCEYQWSLEGIRLNADPEQHPFVGFQGLGSY